MYLKAKKNLFPFIICFLIFICLELINFRQDWLYYLIALIILIVLFSIWHLNNYKFNLDFLRFSITPFFFISGVILFFIFLTPQSLLFRHIYFIIMSAILFLFLKSIFSSFSLSHTFLGYILNGIQKILFIFGHADKKIHFINKSKERKFSFLTEENPEKVQDLSIFSHSYSLIDLSGYLNLLTVFLFSTSLYCLNIFLTLPFWIIELVFLILILFLIYQTLWINKIFYKKNILFLLIITLILGEFFLIISFLPTSFYVNGFILTLFYYLLLEITHFYLLGKLESKTLKRYLIISGLIFLVIILTTQWR